MKKIYLAVPYSGMRDSSYKQVNIATILLLQQGYNVFSPITHSHPLTLISEYEVPGNWEFWQKIDYQFIDFCDEVFVLIPEEGYNKVLQSTGVQAEIKYAQQHNKPIKYFKIQNGTIQFKEKNNTTILS